MRDILNLLDTLNEATNLAPSELKDPNRFEKFLWKIENGDPFLNKAREQVYLEPAEAERFRLLKKAKAQALQSQKNLDEMIQEAQRAVDRKGEKK